MNKGKSLKATLYLTVVVLVVLAGYRVWWKTSQLGMSLSPGQQATTWMIEARVQFEAKGEPAKASLSLPRINDTFQIIDEYNATAGYGFSIDAHKDSKRAIWSIREANGPQRLFYRMTVYDVVGGDFVTPDPETPPIEKPVWSEPQREAAQTLIASVRQRSADTTTFTRQLLRQAAATSLSAEFLLLMKEGGSRVDVAINLLREHGIPARLAHGVRLEDGRRRASMDKLIEVYLDGAWVIFDPKTGDDGLPSDFVLWHRGDQSLLDVEGGINSRVTISVTRQPVAVADMAGLRSDGANNPLTGVPMRSLPIEAQNALKRVLLVPLGALIVVFMRNLIGVVTSGTFMPILIALAFLDTTLLTGLLIFGVIVGVGLLIRGWLSNLNLLLVPRVAAVVVIVTILMVGWSILSYQIGYFGGLSVSFFPMIIIAWTIERLSIAAEEQGAGEALAQTLGSLFVATITYLIIKIEYVQYVIYTFSEVNLVVLALILLAGTYTGYRLTELRRFEPLVREAD